MLFANASNWVRAESLEPASLEALALLLGIFLVWRYRSFGLVGALAISLPFNDVVYRLGPVTISDVLIIVLLLVRRRAGAPWLLGPIFVWLGWGFLSLFVSLGDDSELGVAFFSITYGMRFALLMLLIATLDLSELEGRRCIVALRSVTLLAASVSVVQVVFFRLGLPVNGVFAASGFVRPKGLSHEPSTSAAWFAMALPLLTVSRPLGKPDRLLGLAIAVGLVLTASLSGFIIAAVQVVYALVGVLRRPELRERVRRGAIVAIPVAAISLVLFSGQVGVLTAKVGAAAAEYSTGSRPTNVASGSGREGDLVLLAIEEPGIVSGRGVFASAQLAQEIQEERSIYIPATNAFITTAVDTGVIGLLLFLGALGVIVTRLRRQFGESAPAFVGGFVGFLAVLLGQRLLAFPQPWFMLAVARSQQSARRATDPADVDAFIDHRNEQQGDLQVPDDTRPVTDAIGAVKRYAVSTGAIFAVGLLAVGLAASQLVSSSKWSVDIGDTGQAYVTASLELPVGTNYDFNPTATAFYINHAYKDVTAAVAGDVVAVAANSTGQDEAAEALDDFVSEFLENENADALAALEAGRARSEALSLGLADDIDQIDQQLTDGGLTESVRSELALARASFVRELAVRLSDADSYDLLLERGGPIGKISDIRPVEASSVLRLLVLVAGAGISLLAAVGQAIWRSRRATPNTGESSA